MSNGKMIAFTDNYEDNSTEAGFQFTFFCDICREGYKTRFVESMSYKKRGLLRGLGRVASAGTSIAGRYSGVGHGIETGTDVLSERFEGMSPEWHNEHQQVFEDGQNEAKGHFHRCPKCQKWVCENEWNEQSMLCIECGPREAVEVAAARAEKMVMDIKEKAGQHRSSPGRLRRSRPSARDVGSQPERGNFATTAEHP